MRHKRSLSQTNTSAKDRKNVYPETETQVDVNEIERELLSRDHNLPGTSTYGCTQLQFTSKVQEQRSKLKNALGARKRKSLAPRRPVSCDSAQPRKRQCSRKNSRSQMKFPCKLPTTPAEDTHGTSVSNSSCSSCTPSLKVSTRSYLDDRADCPRESTPTSTILLRQHRDDNENFNAPRHLRRSLSSSSVSSIRLHFKPYKPRQNRRSMLRKKISRTRLPRRKSKTGTRKISFVQRLKQGTQGETSYYCVTPSPGRDASPTLHRSRTSSRYNSRRPPSRSRHNISPKKSLSRHSSYRPRAPEKSRSDSFLSESDSYRNNNRSRSRSRRRHDHHRQERTNYHGDQYYRHEESPSPMLFEEEIPKKERERRTRSRSRSRSPTRSNDADHHIDKRRSARKRRKTRSASNPKHRKRRSADRRSDNDMDRKQTTSRRHKKSIGEESVMTPNRRYLCLLM